jgi:hypothetical protein
MTIIAASGSASLHQDRSTSIDDALTAIAKLAAGRDRDPSPARVTALAERR